jgi:vancomycin resistance protein YoaR
VRTRQLRLVAAAVGLVLLLLVLGFVFAGSPSRLAEGTEIAGVDVGGLAPADATRLLERRAARLENVPVTFTAGTTRWRIRPKALGVETDWRAAVDAAAREGDGFGPVRGYKRLELRFFSGDFEPPIRAYDAALNYELGRIAGKVNAPHREARLVRKGLNVSLVPGLTGRILDRQAAEQVIVRALGSFDRAPVALPVKIDPQLVTAADLRPAKVLAARAIASPVTLTLGPTRWRLPRWRIAKMLELPQDGSSTLALSGPEADAYFRKLSRTVDRAPRNADFAVYANGVRLVPSRPGVTLDVPRTAAAILAALKRRDDRTVALVAKHSAPSLTTAEAKKMGIVGLVGSYETIYGGEANRVHNVQLVAHLVDHKLIAPGTTFSFNDTTGERSAAKGFREAPVIINGELQTGLGGGVCQVSTTVFNAAYEAGLPITSRTNHALYISHYPLGRDATVNYPDIDLKFVNDTGHWLLLRTFVGSSSLYAALYGTPVHRRVETETAPLEEVSAPLVERTPDPTLTKGTTVIEDDGEPARRTSVRRRVYSPSGKLLSDATWYSSYRSEPRVLLVGTKPKPKPQPTTTTTTETDTTTTTTTTTGTTETNTTPTTTAPEPPH